MKEPPSEKIWYLKRIKILSEMDDAALTVLLSKVAHHTFRKRETIFTAWDPGDYIYLLKTGRVKLYMLSDEGREITLAIMEPGEIFGETAIVNPAAREVFAEALDDAEVDTLALEDFQALLAARPDVAMKVTQAIGERLIRTQRQVESLVFADVSTRLARFLLDQIGLHGERDNGTLRLSLALTHQEMANILGTTRETLTSTLNRFVDGGLLAVESRGTLVVRDEALLRSRAHVD